MPTEPVSASPALELRALCERALPWRAELFPRTSPAWVPRPFTAMGQEYRIAQLSSSVTKYTSNRATHDLSIAECHGCARPRRAPAGAQLRTGRRTANSACGTRGAAIPKPTTYPRGAPRSPKAAQTQFSPVANNDLRSPAIRRCSWRPFGARFTPTLSCQRDGMTDQARSISRGGATTCDEIASSAP